MFAGLKNFFETGLKEKKKKQKTKTAPLLEKIKFEKIVLFIS